MSSYSSSTIAAQAYQSLSPQPGLRQQSSALQKQPVQDPATDTPAAGQQPLNSSGRGQLVNITA